MAKKRVKRFDKAPPLFEPIEAQAGQPDYAQTLVRQLWPETPGRHSREMPEILAPRGIWAKGLGGFSEEYSPITHVPATDTLSEFRSIMADFSRLLEALRPKPLIISSWPEDEAELRAVQEALQAEMATKHPLGLPKLEEFTGPVIRADFLGSVPEGGLKDE